MPNLIKGGDEYFFTKFEHYSNMPGAWKQELYNFLVCGYAPGSFHTAIFANDLFGAACKSHISNEWNWIVANIKWLYHYAPNNSYGSYENVNSWLRLSAEERRTACEAKDLLLTEEQVIWRRLNQVKEEFYEE